MIESGTKNLCVNCTSWGHVEALDNGRAQCHRYPPVVGSDGRTRWPLTSSHEGCDEYSATRPKPLDAENLLVGKYEVRVLNDAIDPDAEALRVRLQAELDGDTKAENHATAVDLPLSADGVRIAPGMLVYHSPARSFVANCWVRDKSSHRWLIQSDSERLRSVPMYVDECYSSRDAMLEAANGS